MGSLHYHYESLPVNKPMEQLYNMLMLKSFQGICFLVYSGDRTCRRKLLADVHKLDGNLGFVITMPSEFDLTKTSFTQRPYELVVI